MTGTTSTDAVLADFLTRIDAVRPMIDRLILFGSRARGDHRPDSDYDLLVVARRDPALLDALYDAVMDVLLTHGRLVSLKVLGPREFERLRALETPFLSRVTAEGVPVG
jgi:predicted nucleotidyltransferase